VLVIYAVIFAFSGLDAAERGNVLRRLTMRGSSH
jgi:hypothetical protein